MLMKTGNIRMDGGEKKMVKKTTSVCYDFRKVLPISYQDYKFHL